MHVCHIVESTATGTLSMLLLAVNSQLNEGYKVRVIYSIRPETPSNLNKLFDSRVDLINIQMLTIKDKALSLKKIRNSVIGFKSAVIFMHSSFGGFLGRLALVGVPVKCFYLPHCISFMRKDITSIKRLAFTTLEWLGAFKPATYVACSNSEGEEIKKYIPFRPCVVIENAVNTQAWEYEGGWSTRKHRVITVGQIRLQKDPVRFAQIAKLVLTQNSDIEFIWVGDGDEDSKMVLEKAGVKVLGWKTPGEVKALLQESRYYLSTSLWEGMPVSPIEAMLSGCVAVLSDCAGNIDIVEAEKTGFVFNDTEGAVSTICKLLVDDTLATKVSESGRAHCAEQYSVERYLRDLNMLIKD